MFTRILYTVIAAMGLVPRIGCLCADGDVRAVCTRAAAAVVTPDAGGKQEQRLSCYEHCCKESPVDPLPVDACTEQPCQLLVSLPEYLQPEEVLAPVAVPAWKSPASTVVALLGRLQELQLGHYTLIEHAPSLCLRSTAQMLRV